MESGDQYGPPLPPGGSTMSIGHNLSIMDLENEATFERLLGQSDQEFYPALSNMGLVGSAETFQCPTCGGACKFVPRANRKLCFTFRCRESKNHEFSLTKFSFFEKVKVDLRSLLRFVRSYVLGSSLDECSLLAGLGGSRNLRLDWAAVMREIFVEVVCRTLKSFQLGVEVEINDALVGTVSFEGKSTVHNVWLFGITQTNNNQLLLFPIFGIDESTIIRILQRFVHPGSRILTSPGSLYSRIDFRSCGFEGMLRNPEQTARNSAVWAQNKAHFYKFAESSKILSFESLLCEIMWRSWRRNSAGATTAVFADYIRDLKSIYTFSGPPQFLSTARPLFDTWVSVEDYGICSFSYSFVDAESSVGGTRNLPRPLLLVPSQGLVSSSESNSSKQAAASSSSSRQKVLGPQLPPGLQRSVDSDDLSDEGQLTVKMESPTGTTQDSADSGQDDNVVGPMPSEMCQDGDLMVNTAEQFEMRSKRMKEKLTSKGDAEEGPQKREEWMTELPPEMSKNFGLQARTFSKSRAEDTTGQDRSIWTDTPASKKDKESKGKKRKREEVTSQREEQMQQQVEEYNKANRPESLLEMHNKKQKKKKKKEKKEKKKRKERGEKEEKEARRPFDRDLDLQVNKFDDAQRKLIIQKSAALNTRFSSGGSTSSFL